MTRSVVTSICRSCHGGCGVHIHVEDGRVVGVHGDKRNPNNTGFLCTKGRAAPELANHPQRLRHPLKRLGPRGSGRFQRITWEEAYSLLAERFNRFATESGPESIVLCQGTDRNFQEWMFRFANAVGTPNLLGPAHVCFYPRVMASVLTLGGFTFADYEGDPRCLAVWGSNKPLCHSDGVIGVRLLKARKRGMKLVVIDPRRTRLASEADFWLQPRPGTDAVIALAFLNVVVSSGCYDSEFVEAYTSGFAELKKHVAAFTPGVAEEISGVPAALIREAALFYARSGRSALELGTGIEQNRNSFDCVRALMCLSAICGNLDRPGGDVLWEPTGIVGRRTFPSSDLLPSAQAVKRLGADRHPVLSMSGWAHPASVWRSILSGDPYRVRGMLVLGGNPVLAYADSATVRRALKAIDFLAVGELFQTPTADLADVVLPVSSWLERDQIVEHAHYVAPRRKAVQVGECKPDEEILNELAQRLGVADAFFKTSSDALDYKLAPIGETWRGLVRRGYLPNKLRYEKHRDGGFKTRSGKVNLVCKAVLPFGANSLPVFVPPDAGESVETYPYYLTSRHSEHAFNSEFRQIKSLRAHDPEPFVEIHPRTAEQEGLKDGDYAAVLANGRSLELRVRVTTDVAPETVYVPFGWWYPEAPVSERWKRGNVNILTSPDNANHAMGSSNLRGLRCALRRVGSKTLS